MAVRVQMWAGDAKIEVRGWLDEFEVGHDTIERIGWDAIPKTYLPTGLSHFKVQGHSEPGGWRFETRNGKRVPKP